MKKMQLEADAAAKRAQDIKTKIYQSILDNETKKLSGGAGANPYASAAGVNPYASAGSSQASTGSTKVQDLQ